MANIPTIFKNSSSTANHTNQGYDGYDDDLDSNLQIEPTTTTLNFWTDPTIFSGTKVFRTPFRTCFEHEIAHESGNVVLTNDNGCYYPMLS